MLWSTEKSFSLYDTNLVFDTDILGEAVCGIWIKMVLISQCAPVTALITHLSNMNGNK
jgi:hypothetical protein